MAGEDNFYLLLLFGRDDLFFTENSKHSKLFRLISSS